MASRWLRRRAPLPVYLTLEAGSALLLGMIFTVNLIYQVTVVALDPLQLVLVGTLLETVVFVFEVPTGLVADVYSRRLSVILGVALIGAGFVLEGAIARFEAVLAAQIVWGLGATFTSGATQAWIADEVGEARAASAFLRGAQAGLIGGIVGALAGMALGSVNIRLPIVLGGALLIALALILAAIMPERGFTPVPRAERQTWGAFARTLREGLRLVRGRALLVVFLGVTAVFGLFSEGVDRLSTAHLLRFDFPTLGGLQPVVWLGLLGIAGRLLTVIGTEIVQRRVVLRHSRGLLRILLWLTAGTVGGLAVFGTAPTLLVAALASLWIGTLRGITDPVLTAWINPQIESNVRATVFSLASQLNAIGQIAGGPGVGWIGRAVSLRAALLTSAGLLTPALGLFGWALRRTEGSSQSTVDSSQ